METTNPASHVVDSLVASVTLPITCLACQVFQTAPSFGTSSKEGATTIPLPVILHIYLMLENCLYFAQVLVCILLFRFLMKVKINE